MAYIKLELDHPITNGESVTFIAPCDCSDVLGLKVYYNVVTESTTTPTSKIFDFKDAHGNNLATVGNLFTSGASVSVILNTIDGSAYIKNADTNGYLENKLATLEAELDGKVPFSGGTMSGALISHTGTDYTTFRMRNIAANTTAYTSGTTSLANGYIYLRYE